MAWRVTNLNGVACTILSTSIHARINFYQQISLNLENILKYHMRRIDRALNDTSKLDKVLMETRYISLALCKNNTPYIVTLSHAYDPGAKCIYFHCASSGRKLDYMKANPYVCGQALIDKGFVEGKCNHLYVSVTFEGRVEFVEELPEKRRIFRYMFANQDRRSESLKKSDLKVDPHLTRIGSDVELNNVIVGRILIDELTGKISKDIDME